MKAALATLAFASPLLLHWAIVWESDVLLRTFLLLWAAVALYAGIERGLAWGYLIVAGLLTAVAFWIDTSFTRALAPVWAAVVYGFLAWLFGRTLRPGVMPLVERIARLEHPQGVPPDLPAYARRVNWIWMWFFIVLAVVTIVMTFTISTETLSLFTNIVSWVLLVILHLSEHCYRMWWRFPNLTHKNPLKVVIAIVRSGPQLLR